MKNELGIEVCCENCERCCEMSIILAQRKLVRESCLKNKKAFFKPFKFLLVARIKELQEQQFTKEELRFIKNRLDDVIEEWDVPDMVFMAHQILKKIEQTLKNSKENLNKQQ